MAISRTDGRFNGSFPVRSHRWVEIFIMGTLDLYDFKLSPIQIINTLPILGRMPYLLRRVLKLSTECALSCFHAHLLDLIHP